MRNRALLIAILLLAFAVRVNDLELNPLWFDESMEYWVATSPLDELLQGVKIAIQDPPLYSVMLHFWTALGNGEFTLRLLSTFASILSIAGLYVLGRRVHSEEAGIIAALILALIPPDIRFAQEVGQYAFLVLALVFYLLLLDFALDTNSWKYWIAWSIVGLMGVYTYYGSMLVIIPTAAISFVVNLVRSGWKHASRQAIAIGLFALMVIPLLVSWLPDQLLRGPTANAFVFHSRPLSTEIETFLTQTRDVMAYQLTGYLPDPTPWIILTTAAWLFVLIALLFVLRKGSNNRQVVLWLLLSWAVYFLAGRFGAYPYGGTRHALILTPLIVLSMAVGIAAIWHLQRIAGLAFLIGIVIVVALAPREPPQDMRTVAEQWLSSRTEDTPTYIYDGAVPSFRYQIELQGHKTAGVRGIWYRECWAGQPKPYCSEENVHYGRWIRQLSPDEKVEEITSVVGLSDGQFWLILSQTTDSERLALLEAFDPTYITLETIEATGAHAYLLQTR